VKPISGKLIYAMARFSAVAFREEPQENGRAGPPTLSENDLRPAGQTGGNGAKIIAAGDRNTRQVGRQRFLNQR
jgi:hypothetical protein